MGTIRQAADQDTWTIKAKLVHKMIFIKWHPKGTLKLLKMTFVDESGDTIEMLSKSEGKAYTVYRKARNNEVYIIRNSNYKGAFREPHPKYSTELYQAYNFHIEFDQGAHMKRGYVKVYTNLEEIKRKICDGPVNIFGILIEYKIGPPYNKDTKRPYQGYFVTLMDEGGQFYRVLVWHSKYVERSKFPLFHSRRGDTALITAAREGWPNDQKTMYTLTSPRPIVLNSDCVHPRGDNSLKSAYQPSKGPEHCYLAIAAEPQTATVYI